MSCKRRNSGSCKRRDISRCQQRSMNRAKQRRTYYSLSSSSSEDGETPMILYKLFNKGDQTVYCCQNETLLVHSTNRFSWTHPCRQQVFHHALNHYQHWFKSFFTFYIGVFDLQNGMKDVFTHIIYYFVPLRHQLILK